jgi:formylglycine-generating enzyme required for sulfatase activity
MKIRFGITVAVAILAPFFIGCASLQRPRPGTTFRDCGECPLMVVIPPGSFVMGDGLYGNPAHQVKIPSSFAVAKDLVTRSEYREFAAESGYAVDRSSQNASLGVTGGYPAVNVSWQDAQAYARWLSEKTGHRYRLLSESEYEYAERSGSKTAFWWGDEAAPVCSYANFHNCSSGPTAVGAYLPNAFGLDDMTGNVFEWVQDCWHSSYDAAPGDGSAWSSTDCSSRVMRGTPWFMIDPTPLRSSYRAESDFSDRSDVIGFRVARDLQPRDYLEL